MAQSDEDNIKLSKYITDRILVNFFSVGIFFEILFKRHQADIVNLGIVKTAKI